MKPSEVKAAGTLDASGLKPAAKGASGAAPVASASEPGPPSRKDAAAQLRVQIDASNTHVTEQVPLTESSSDRGAPKSQPMYYNDRPFNVYLLGPPGGGKSTAINGFMKSPVAQVASGHAQATTEHVKVYSQEPLMPNDLGLSLAVKIDIFDTPGFPRAYPSDTTRSFNKIVDSDDRNYVCGVNKTGVHALILVVKTDPVSVSFWEDLKLLLEEIDVRLADEIPRYLLVNVVASEDASYAEKMRNGALSAQHINGILDWCKDSNFIISTGFAGCNLGQDIVNCLLREILRLPSRISLQRLLKMEDIIHAQKEAFQSMSSAVEQVHIDNSREINDLDAKFREIETEHIWLQGEIQRLAIGATCTAAAGILAAPFSGGLSLLALTGGAATEVGRQVRIQQLQTLKDSKSTAESRLQDAKQNAKLTEETAEAIAISKCKKFYRLAKLTGFSFEFPEWFILANAKNRDFFNPPEMQT